MKKLTKSQLKQIILQEIGTMRMGRHGTHRDRPGYRGATVRGRVERRMPTVEKMAAQMGMEASTLADMLEDELLGGSDGMAPPGTDTSDLDMGSGQDPADLGPMAEAAYNRIVERRRRREALNEDVPSSPLDAARRFIDLAGENPVAAALSVSPVAAGPTLATMFATDSGLFKDAQEGGEIKDINAVLRQLTAKAKEIGLK